jgi:hypothetical protein
MVKVKYDPNSIKNARNTFSVSTDAIIESLNNIYNEYLNIDKYLNTPKSREGVPAILEEYNRQINFFSEKKEDYDALFNAVEIEYQKEIERTRKMVGSDYEA